MDTLIEAALDAAALRKPQSAQDILGAIVEWHAENESEILPTALLALLVAARSVC